MTASIFTAASAEYVYIEPGTRLYKIPDEMSDDMAVFTEVMCVA